MRSRIAISLFLFTFGLFSQKAFGQIKLQVVTPGSQNISMERLNRIGAQIDQWIKEEQLNTAAAIILRNSG